MTDIGAVLLRHKATRLVARALCRSWWL